MSEAPGVSASVDGSAATGGLERFRDFSAALRRGDARAALEAARDACLAEPDRAEAHYAFGQAWMAAGKPARAEYVWLIALLFPKAKIIHCVRDPRDIGFSIFTFRFYGEHGYAHDLSDLGWMIGEQHRVMSHWKAALPILTLRLDDWVKDFDATLARVLDFVDLTPDPACARFYDADAPVRTVSRARLRQPVNARGLGRWRPYARELQPLIEELERAGALDGWSPAASVPVEREVHAPSGSRPQPSTERQPS
jgi:hypothetical protein